MAARTQKQRDQWTTRTILGDVSGLPHWINAKVPRICQHPAIDEHRKESLVWAANYLKQQLNLAEIDIRFHTPADRLAAKGIYFSSGRVVTKLDKVEG